MSQHPSEFLQHRFDLNMYMSYALYFDYKYGFLLNPPGILKNEMVTPEAVLEQLLQINPVTDQELDWLKQLWLAEQGVGPREGILAYFMQVMKTGERHALMESELFPNPLKVGVLSGEPKPELLKTPALQLIVNKAVPMYMESIAMLLQLKETCFNAHVLTSFMTIYTMEIPSAINVLETDCGPLSKRLDQLAEQMLVFGAEYHAVRIPMSMRHEFANFSQHCGGAPVSIALGLLYPNQCITLQNGPSFVVEGDNDD